MNALQKLLNCYLAAGEDLTTLKSDYFSYSSETQDESAAWSAKRLSCLCSVYSDDYEGAIDEMRDLLDAAPFPSDSVLVEIDILSVQELLEQNTDQSRDYEQKRGQLEAMLEDIDTRREMSSGNILPENDALTSIYPNPFNSATTIGFVLNSKENVGLEILDLSGRLVAEIVDGKAFEAGNYRVTLAGDRLPAGIYFCRFQTEQTIQTQKLVLVK